MTELDEIRQAVRRLCIDFPETYWVVELANSAAPFPTATDHTGRLPPSPPSPRTAFVLSR